MSEQISAALRNGEAQKALELAKALLEQAADKADAYYWLALSHQSLGDTHSALSAIDQAIALAPEHNDYAMVRSVMLLGDRDLNAAQSGLMDTLALNPNQLEAYIGLIHIALAQRNLPEAQRLLRMVERIDPDQEQVLVAKGSIAQAQGDFDLALKCFTAATDGNPNNVLALSGMGTCYLQKQMPSFAEQALKRASELALGNIGVLRALCQSQLDLQNFAEAEQTVSRVLTLKPDDLPSLNLRAQLRAQNNNAAGALVDAQAAYAQRPQDANALTYVCTLLLQQGEIAQAKELLEAALKNMPDSEAHWQLRYGFETAIGGDSQEILEAWLQRLPESALAHEALAVYLESAGQLAEAAVVVDKALSITENLALAQFVKLRQETRENPTQALARAEQLAKSANSPESQRMILAWLGLINDKLGQFNQAAEAFGQMTKYVLAFKPLPTISPSLNMSTDASIEGKLLWSPPGARIERVLNVLAPALRENLLVDRNQPSPARIDGFGPIRANPGSSEAGTALNWSTGILALGLQPKDVLDWIPHWDAYTADALQGTELVAVVIDPRDALLNWLVFGSAQSYMFLPILKHTATWLAAGYHSIADTIENGPQKVHLIKMDDLDSKAVEICVQLQEALDLNIALDARQLAKPVFALGGMPNQFPAGHWRHYQDYFAEAFSELTPAAVRLGYPEK